MSNGRGLTNEEFVRLVIEEVRDPQPSAVNQIIYLLERVSPEPPRFRFTFQPFLGMRSAELDGLVQSAEFSVMLGRNGMPGRAEQESRMTIREFIAGLPAADHDLRLIAVADFVAQNRWHERARLSLADMIERARYQFAPDSKLNTDKALALLRELTDCRDEALTSA
jgi:hypothetical protein